MPTFEYKSRPNPDIFPSKSQILDKSLKYSDSLGILGRDLDSCGIFQQIEVPKRMKLIKYGLLSAISDNFSTFLPPKVIYRTKVLKNWTIRMSLKDKKMPKTIIFRGCEEICTNYRGSRDFV